MANALQSKAQATVDQVQNTFLHLKCDKRSEVQYLLEQAPPSNNRRIWDKKADKFQPRISAADPMRCLFEEFRQIKETLESNSNTASGISLHENRYSSVDCISLLVH